MARKRCVWLWGGRQPIQKLPAIQKLRFRNYDSETSPGRDSETISPDSETVSPESETNLARFRIFFCPNQKLFPIQKQLSPHSETIIFSPGRWYVTCVHAQVHMVSAPEKCTRSALSGSM